MNPQLSKLAQLKVVLPQQLSKLLPKQIYDNINLNSVTSNNCEYAANSIRTKTFLSLLQRPKIHEPQPILTQQPIILVFCQPSEQLSIDGDNIYPYVPVSYCSWVQGGGGKCIPLPYNLNEGSMQYLIERSNGLLIPGGGANLYKNYFKKEGFGPVMIGFQKIWRFIQKIWAKGIYFPIWGTCLGLQIIMMVISNDVKVLSNLNSRMHQLQIYSDYQKSKFLKNMPTKLKLKIQNNKILNFQHAHGISVSKFHKYPKLQQKLNIISISKDKDGKWFCSALEGKQWPIFISQFHPQKQGYQWSKNGDIIHHRDAVDVSQFMASSFVSECRKCKPLHHFSDPHQQFYYSVAHYRQIPTPIKQYRVYAIDFKYRFQQSKKIRKQSQKIKSKSMYTKEPFL